MKHAFLILLVAVAGLVCAVLAFDMGKGAGERTVTHEAYLRGSVACMEAVGDVLVNHAVNLREHAGDMAMRTDMLAQRQSDYLILLGLTYEELMEVLTRIEGEQTELQEMIMRLEQAHIWPENG